DRGHVLRREQAAEQRVGEPLALGLGRDRLAVVGDVRELGHDLGARAALEDLRARDGSELAAELVDRDGAGATAAGATAAPDEDRANAKVDTSHPSTLTGRSRSRGGNVRAGE